MLLRELNYSTTQLLSGLPRYIEGNCFLSYSARYILAAKCGASGARKSRFEYESTFRKSLRTDEVVVSAILPLIEGVSSFWTKVKANELREILPGLIASDLSMAKKVKIRKKSKNRPGLAFLPWKTLCSVHVRARSDAGSPSGCCCCKARPRRMVSAVLMNTEKAFLTCLGDYKPARQANTDWMRRASAVESGLQPMKRIQPVDPERRIVEETFRDHLESLPQIN